MLLIVYVIYHCKALFTLGVKISDYKLQQPVFGVRLFPPECLALFCNLTGSWEGHHLKYKHLKAQEVAYTRPVTNFSNFYMYSCKRSSAKTSQQKIVIKIASSNSQSYNWQFCLALEESQCEQTLYRLNF